MKLFHFFYINLSKQFLKYKMTDYNQMNLKQLKQRGREMGLLRVERNNKKELIERLKKGKQPSDYNKNVLLEQAQNEGILVNATMSKR